MVNENLTLIFNVFLLQKKGIKHRYDASSLWNVNGMFDNSLFGLLASKLWGLSLNKTIPKCHRSNIVIVSARSYCRRAWFCTLRWDCSVGYTSGKGSGSNETTLSYKGTPFHRIVSGFIIQGGDAVVQRWQGKPIHLLRYFQWREFQAKSMPLQVPSSISQDWSLCIDPIYCRGFLAILRLGEWLMSFLIKVRRRIWLII